MTESDKQAIRNDIKRLLRLMKERDDALKSGSPEQQSESSLPSNPQEAIKPTTESDWEKLEEETRGLENFLPAKLLVRRQATRAAIRQVIQQQTATKKLSDEWILNVYNAVTAPAVWDAHVRGLADQQQHLASPPPLQIMIR